MKKHPNSPHLSVKRLRELAGKYPVIVDPKSNAKAKRVTQVYMELMNFIRFVESQRSSLTSKKKKV